MTPNKHKLIEEPDEMSKHFVEMADRIEELEKACAEWAEVSQSNYQRAKAAEAKLATCEKYRDAYAECDRIGTQAVRDLEAKLAKAVEALKSGRQTILELVNSRWSEAEGLPEEWVSEIDAILAELKE